MTDPHFPRMAPLDRLRMLVLHDLNALGRGIVIGRPKMALVLDRLQADRRLIAMLDRLHDRYQGDPVWTRGLNGTTLLPLSPSDCRRVLSGSDQTYAMATPLKRRTMGHLQPDGLILTRPGELRAHRRQFNEVVLDWGREVHREAATFIEVVNQEVDALIEGPMATGRPLTYRAIRRTFQRIGRRCVLGDAAAEDVEMSELLDALRREGNWLGLRFWRRNRTHALRARFIDRVHRYMELGRHGSLVGRFADLPTEARLHPSGQVAHWLMAFDIQPVIVTRTLGLLATHPQHLTPIEEELADADRFHGTGSSNAVLAMPYLLASVLEAARLWPVVRDLARLMARDADWDGHLVPKDAEVLISTVYHGRAAYRGRAAHRFTPQQWIDGSADGDWGLSPASRGPAGCPGADLGFFIVTGFLAECLRRSRFRLLSLELRPDLPLPVNYDPFGAKFAVAEKPDAPPTVTVPMGPGYGDYGED